MRSFFSILSVTCLLLAAAGCARSPQVRFYELTPAAVAGAPAGQAAPTAAGAAVAPAAPAAPTVAIGPVTLPEVVDRPQLVVQDGASRVRILETRRWAESLKSGIPRFLAHDMGARLGSNGVFSYLEMTGVAADYRVAVDFRRFEVVPADAVTIDADWLIRHAGKSVRTGHSAVQRKVEGEGYDAIVAAYRAALSALGGDLAAAVSELQRQKP